MQLRTGKTIVYNVSSPKIEPVKSSQNQEENGLEDMRTKIQNLESQILDMKKENEILKKNKNTEKVKSAQLTELRRLLTNFENVASYDKNKKIYALMDIYQYLYKEFSHFLDKNSVDYLPRFIKTVIEKSKELKQEIINKLKNEIDDQYIQNSYKCYYYIDNVLQLFEKNK